MAKEYLKYTLKDGRIYYTPRGGGWLDVPPPYTCEVVKKTGKGQTIHVSPNCVQKIN